MTEFRGHAYYTRKRLSKALKRLKADCVIREYTIDPVPAGRQQGFSVRWWGPGAYARNFMAKEETEQMCVPIEATTPEIRKLMLVRKLLRA